MSIDIEKFTRAISERVRALIDPIEQRLSDLENREDDEFKLLVYTTIEEKVAEYLKAHPPEKGDDGVGMAGAVINRSGELTITMSDGTNRDLGPVVGKDGIGFEEMTPHYDKENDEIVWQYKSGNITKEVRQPACTPRHAGFWQPGMRIKCGHFVTHNGNLWYANVTTGEEPSLKSDDWQLSARKGADK